ncbi:hypothetical protein TNCV_2888601 [Trichonephila clavipes]|nr:hypothetical protein TNCV_2888601 [Trichonephila clavipes]
MASRVIRGSMPELLTHRPRYRIRKGGHIRRRPVQCLALCRGATRGLLVTDLVILNHDQVTNTTPDLAPTSPNYHTTPMEGRLSSRQI